MASECISSYGPESGPHTDDPEWAAVFHNKLTGKDVGRRIGPLCLGHAQYEQTWRDAWGMITRARVEPFSP
jgi:hypothetical protein